MLPLAANVYIINDDLPVRAGLVAALGQRFHTIQTHPSGEEFLQRHKLNGVGCLIVANNLPGMTSADLILRLASEHSALAAIITTTAGTFQVAVNAFHCGAFDIMELPVAAA